MRAEGDGVNRRSISGEKPDGFATLAVIDQIGEGVVAEVADRRPIDDVRAGEGEAAAIGGDAARINDRERIAIRIGVVGARVESIGGVVLTT